MQKLNSKHGQVVGSIIGIIIWAILALSMLYLFFTNQFPTITGKVINGIFIIVSIIFLVGNVRSYWKNRNQKETLES